MGLCLVILAAGLAVQNEYRRQHRRIDVLNGLGKPVLVALDGGAPVEFKQAGTLPVAEGRHHVRITGAVEEEFDVDVGAGYFQRWTSSPRWVINPGGAVPLTSTTVHYAAKPGPPQVRLLVGERFVALPHVDYAFEAPPATLNVDSVQSDVVKEVLDQVSGIPPETIFRAALKSSSPDKVLTYGEAVLLRNPNDGGFSALYYNTAIGENEAARALRFLKKGLAERPVCIPWHRAYQQIEEFSGNSAALEAQYEELLNQEPTSAALLYLTARVSRDHKRSGELFKQSTVADPKLPWGWYALAYDDANHGDWNSCCEKFSHIAKPEHLTDESAELYALSRLGSGKAALIEAECRPKLAAARGLDAIPDLFHLVDALLVEGKLREAKEAAERWTDHLPAEIRTNAEIVGQVESVLWYYLGDFDRIKRSHPAAGPTPSPILLSALLATGEADTLLKRPEAAKFFGVSEFAFDISIACQLAGKRAEADSWREKAAQAFDKAKARDTQRMAAFLRTRIRPRSKNSIASTCRRPRGVAWRRSWPCGSRSRKNGSRSWRRSSTSATGPLITWWSGRSGEAERRLERNAVRAKLRSAGRARRAAVRRKTLAAAR